MSKVTNIKIFIENNMGDNSGEMHDVRSALMYWLRQNLDTTSVLHFENYLRNLQIKSAQQNT